MNILFALTDALFGICSLLILKTTSIQMKVIKRSKKINKNLFL
jgi:hypothetical protein